MRVKTDGRRQAILGAALQVFREVSYQRASMAAIAARVGGSKATLYSYFKSKEELFAAAMVSALDDQGQEAIGLLDPSDPDVASVLRRFGEAELTLLTSSDAIAILRAAIAEGGNSQLGAMLFKIGPESAWSQVRDYLVELQGREVLRPADPQILAAHLKGLLESGVVEPLLFGADPWFTPKDAAATAVDAFLRLYGAGTPGRSE